MCEQLVQGCYLKVERESCSLAHIKYCYCSAVLWCTHNVVNVLFFIFDLSIRLTDQGYQRMHVMHITDERMLQVHNITLAVYTITAVLKLSQLSTIRE